MKKSVIILVVTLLACMPAIAQTESNLDSEMGGCFSLAVDKKLAKGLHLRLEEEISIDNNFGTFDRFYTTLGLNYKVNDYLKLGVAYAMINPYSAANHAFKDIRHRLILDATGGFRFGHWRLSLKERFRATYRTGEMNLYQNPRTALTLRSRLKLQYKGLRRIEPYAYIELRNILNAPVIDAVYNTATDTWGYYSDGTFTQKGEAGWFIDGWNGCYVNRLRGTVGVEYRLSRYSSVDISLMADHKIDKVVDANAEGTKLKSYTLEKGFVGWLSVGYCYSF